MTKRTVKGILCAALMALTLSMTACGSSTQTLEGYFNSNASEKAAIEEEIAGAGNESMTVTAEVKENDFIFNFTIVDEALLIDGISEQLDAGLEATASVFEQVAAQLDEMIEQEGVVSIVIRYLNPDGDVLAERSFKAQ
ncbi:MAG: DUF4854 domain-containing protein [Clostridium sp.]|nr:DUF4854 domain-containing protein [Lachnoclostridium sp.]MCM1254140.1 DUF4854 domain-containing protein [Clostridium sp.]